MEKKVNIILLIAVVFMTVFTTIIFFQKKQTNKHKAEAVIEKPLLPSSSNIQESLENIYDKAIESITDDELKQTVYHLADYNLYHGRATGQAGNLTASQWIKEQLESYGLPTMYDPFKTLRGETRNIYAWIEGSENPNEIIVVGAHFDHIASSPGADDNASGVSLLLELAEAFAELPKEEIKKTILFQFYSAEELGLLGSQYYCNHPKFPINAPNINNHTFMLNVDMVGRLNNQQYIMLYEEKVDEVGQFIQDLSSKYPFALSITKRGPAGSDHTAFLNKNVCVGWISTGIHADYHTSRDTADKIDYNGLEKISRYAFELVYRIDHQKRNFCTLEDSENFKNIQEMLFDHNHKDYPFSEQLKN